MGTALPVSQTGLHGPARASLVAQMVKNLPAVQETQVQSLGGEDPLEKGRQPTPIFLPGAWWATVHGIAKSQTRLSD